MIRLMNPSTYGQTTLLDLTHGNSLKPLLVVLLKISDSRFGETRPKTKTNAATPENINTKILAMFFQRRNQSPL